MKDLEIQFYIEKLTNYTNYLGIPFALLLFNYVDKLQTLHGRISKNKVIELMKEISVQFDEFYITEDLRAIRQFLREKGYEFQTKPQSKLTKFEKTFYYLILKESEIKQTIQKLTEFSNSLGVEDKRLIGSILIDIRALISNELSEINDEYCEYMYEFLYELRQTIYFYESKLLGIFQSKLNILVYKDLDDNSELLKIPQIAEIQGKRKQMKDFQEKDLDLNTSAIFKQEKNDAKHRYDVLLSTAGFQDLKSIADRIDRLEESDKTNLNKSLDSNINTSRVNAIVGLKNLSNTKKETYYNPRFCTYFIYNDILQFEGEESINMSEYLIIGFPISDHYKNYLKRMISSFLNTMGGRIYLGVTENLEVKGIKIQPRLKGNVISELKSLVKDFYPSVSASSFQIHFLPVKESRNDRVNESKELKYIKNLYVIKIILKNSTGLFSMTTKGFLPYRRKNGDVFLMSASEIVNSFTNIQEEQNREGFSDMMDNSVNFKELAEFEDPNPEVTVDDSLLYNPNFSFKNCSTSVCNSRGYILNLINIPSEISGDFIGEYLKSSNSKSQTIYEKDGKCTGWGNVYYSSYKNASYGGSLIRKLNEEKGFKIHVKIKEDFSPESNSSMNSSKGLI